MHRCQNLKRGERLYSSRKASVSELGHSSGVPSSGGTIFEAENLTIEHFMVGVRCSVERNGVLAIWISKVLLIESHSGSLFTNYELTQHNFLISSNSYEFGLMRMGNFGLNTKHVQYSKNESWTNEKIMYKFRLWTEY